MFDDELKADTKLHGFDSIQELCKERVQMKRFLRQFGHGMPTYIWVPTQELKDKYQEYKQGQERAEALEAEALRAPPIPKGTGIRAGDLL